MKPLLPTAFSIILSVFLCPNFSWSQSCDNWLYTPNQPSYVRVGDLDIPGDKVTVEAVFTRTSPWSGVDLFQGDLVSKHLDPKDVNYLLRPSSAEITTTNGYFKTPTICPIELNKTYHAALVYDGATLKFYRNGFLMSQIAATGNLIQNDWQTQIGLFFNQQTQENFIGYIKEVRIWNIVRTQSEIRSYMDKPLPSPATMPGLLAYYNFDNLKNKQGNTKWDGALGGSASINQTNANCTFVADSCGIIPKPPITVRASFTTPDTVCVNTPVSITNTSSGASSYYWNFCVADLNTTPSAVNMGNIAGMLSKPVFIDYAYYNHNYYGFLIDYNPGQLIRLDFGNSLLNIPTAVNLGNFGSIIPPGEGAEGIQVVQNEGKWYAIIVGGYPQTGSTPRILKIDFGTNLTNASPVATNWGNLGNMQQPLDLHVFKEGNNWYGLTVNAENNTITRFNFTNSFDNTPSGDNLGNVGKLSYPTGIYAIDDNGFWRVFIVNGGSRANNTTPGGSYSLTRLDFGTSLLNSPKGVNLGNPGNLLQHPRDLTIMKMCNQIIGFAVNGNTSYNDIVKIDFNNNLSAIPTLTTLGNIGGLSFPHSISKLFRVNSDVYSFVTNVNDNTITRLKFNGCNNSSLPGSILPNPAPVTYNAPGTYSINLTIDDGLPTQTAFCKQVVVVPAIQHLPLKDIAICKRDSIRIGTSSNPAVYTWNTGVTSDSISVKTGGLYWVQSNRYGCTNRDSFNVVLNPLPALQLTKDTGICEGASVNLNAQSNEAVNIRWLPATGLSNASVLNPLASPTNTTKYKAIVIANNGCSNSDSVLVTVHPKPVFSLQPSPASICYGDTIQLSASGGNVFNWLPTGAVKDPTAATATVSPSETTIYTVAIKNLACHMDDTLSTTIAVNSLPTITIKKSNDIDCLTGEAQLTASGGVKYQWNNSGSLSDAHVYNPTASPAQTTIYSVKATSVENCSAVDSITVFVSGNGRSRYDLPSAFTPNGDGLNDCFEVRYWGGIKEFSMNIYNRWGEKVFSTTKANDCWNGTYKGKSQPADVYVYYIKAKTLCGEAVKKGTIMLIR